MFVSKSSVQNLLRRGAAACFCNGRFSYASPAGYDHAQQLARSKDCLIREPSSLLEWTSRKIHAKSPITFECLRCKTVDSTTLDCFRSNLSIRCRCSNNASWGTESGRLRFLELCSSMHIAPPPVSETALQWQCASVTDTTRFSVRCLECGDQLQRCIKSLRKERLWCGCSLKGQPWAGEDGRKRLVEIIETTRFVPAGFVADPSAWSSRCVTNETRIPMVCSDCKHFTESTILSMFVRVRSSYCLCSGTLTLREIVAFCKFKFTDLFLKLEDQVFGSTLRFDISFRRHEDDLMPFAAIELDGPQHFEFPNPFHRSENEFVQNQHRDGRKNALAFENGTRLLRLDFESIRGDHVNWKQVVFDFLDSQKDQFLCVSHRNAYGVCG